MKMIEIDFSELRALDENIRKGFIGTFGITLKDLLMRMFGGEKIPLIVKGTPKEVRAFAKALVKEKDYYRFYKEYGLNNPKTYRSKWALKAAIREFERKTGMKWPLTHRR